VKNGRWQAKDIDDAFFLRCVEHASTDPNPPVPWASSDRTPYAHFPHWTNRHTMQCLMPIFPPEVILAKASALMRRGLLGGCDCGCRGDFELTDKGRAFLEVGRA
jgi:hypothetical protein